jgi:LssY C-terminus
MVTDLRERLRLLAKPKRAAPAVRCSSACVLLLGSLFVLSGRSWGEAALIVPAGTPVELRLIQTVSSARAQSGDRIEFIVLRDVDNSGLTVIRAGAKAWGSVTAVHGKRPFGLPGILVVSADTVEIATGEYATLYTPVQFKGHPHFLRMTAEGVVAALIFPPAAPLVLLTPGTDSVALENTEITAYLSADVPLSAARLPAAADPSLGLDKMFQFLQPRVLDRHGREGDLVNLLFVAQQSDLERAFERAGWISVDRSKPLIAWHLLCHGTHYTGLPMANFFLFGRTQDYGYAMPDPSSILSKRHHVRIWKTNYRVQGTPVWLAAATHDVTIAMHKLTITHDIDPQVDAERDFIGDNLSGTRLVAHSEYLSSTRPVFQATTTNGQRYYSDSRILLVQLTQPSATRGVASGRTLHEDERASRAGAAFATLTQTQSALQGQNPGAP